MRAMYSVYIHIEPPIPPTLHRYIHPAGILSKKRICFPTKSIVNSVHVLTVLYRAEGPLPDHYAVYMYYIYVVIYLHRKNRYGCQKC